MGDMNEIRNVISEGLGHGLPHRLWVKIKAAIDAARPPIKHVEGIMEKLRDEIDAALPYNVPRMSDRAWTAVKAAIDAAQPPGDDEIRAALRELGESRKEDPCGIQIISAHASDREWLMTWWSSNRPLVAAIRSMIPPPEPTVKELLDAVEQSMHCHIDSTLATAFRNLRKRLEDQ